MHTICRRDLKAISDFLGSKKFLFGDKPCVTDAVLFAFTNCFVTLPRGSRSAMKGYLEGGTVPNLVRHFERMKARFWPDFDEVNSRSDRVQYYYDDFTAEHKIKGA